MARSTNRVCFALAWLALVLMMGAPICGAIAADSAQKQKAKPPPLADFADDARMDVLRWLVKLEPAFAIFQKRFTSARPIFTRSDAYSPRISVTVIFSSPKYTVTFITSAEFADDLSTASRSRVEAFTALVTIEGRTYNLRLPPSDMKEFAADPDAYIEKAKAAAARQK